MHPMKRAGGQMRIPFCQICFFFSEFLRFTYNEFMRSPFFATMYKLDRLFENEKKCRRFLPLSLFFFSLEKSFRLGYDQCVLYCRWIFSPFFFIVFADEIFNWINYSNLQQWAWRQYFISITGNASAFHMHSNSIHLQSNCTTFHRCQPMIIDMKYLVSWFRIVRYLFDMIRKISGGF